MWRLAKKEARERPFTGLAPLEADATSIQEYAVAAVPPLLQTPAYAEEQLRAARPDGPEQVAAQLKGRLERQARLAGGAPVHYRALIDESVLRREARDPDTWSRQLEHLVQAAQLPHVSVHIVPFGHGPHPLRGPLELVFLPDGTTLAHTENTCTGHLIEEPEDVEPLRLAYDMLRDTALTPAETLDLLRKALDDHRGEHQDPTA